MNEILNLSVEKDGRISNRECERKEFKLDYDSNNLWKYAKTMAAFANRDGGAIFFGIKDKPRELVGIEKIEIDELPFANFLKSHFEPEIKFEFGSKEYLGKKLVYVLVEPAYNKPIICKKEKKKQHREKGKQDELLLREGAVYYRYSSSTEEIKFPELQKILEERTQKMFRSMVDNVTLIHKIGHDRAAIVDATQLSGNDKTASVYITSETAKNINWIRKGKFAEQEGDGAKAYFVTREIEIKHGVEIEKPVDPGKTHTLTKTALTNSVGINGLRIDAILWKLGLLEDPQYHLSGNHGQNIWHKFTESTKDKILDFLPLNEEEKKRNERVKKINEEYKQTLRQKNGNKT